MKKNRNVNFYPNRITYNAIRKFNDNIIKIPDYVVNEVMIKQTKIDIYHGGAKVASYDFTNIRNYIKHTERKSYPGKFRDQDINYHLIHIEV